MPLVDKFIADLKESVAEASENPTHGGTMVRLYGT